MLSSENALEASYILWNLPRHRGQILTQLPSFEVVVQIYQPQMTRDGEAFVTESLQARDITSIHTTSRKEIEMHVRKFY